MGYRKNGEFLEGEEVLRIASKVNPNDFVVYYNFAICCRKIGLVDESEEHLKTAMNIIATPILVENMINREMARTYEKQMKWEEAVALYQSILKTDPSNLSVRMDALRIIDYTLKDRKWALKKYKEALHALETHSLDDHKQKQLTKYFNRRIKKLQEEEFWSVEGE